MKPGNAEDASGPQPKKGPKTVRSHVSHNFSTSDVGPDNVSWNKFRSL